MPAPQTSTPTEDAITAGAIVRLPSGRQAHVNSISGQVANVSLVDDAGRVDETETRRILSSLTLVAATPPEASPRSTFSDMGAWRCQHDLIADPVLESAVALEGSRLPSRRDLAAHAALPALLIGATTGEIEEDAGRIAFRAYRVADALEYAARDAVDTRPVYEAELRRVTRIFERYADIHRAKGTEEGNRKAEENAAEAGRIRNLMRKAQEADARASVTRQDLEADIGTLLAQIDAARAMDDTLWEDPEDIALIEQIRARRKASTGEAAR